MISFWENSERLSPISMPIVKKNLLVPYSALQMFELVDDVLSYPQFLPWCARSQEFSRSIDEVRAELTLKFGGIEKGFQTCNRRQPGKMLEIRLLEGPFEHLEGFWLFQDLPDSLGSQVDFHLSFEFSQSWIGKIFGGLFHQVTQELVNAFYQRAQVVYGPQT